MLSKSHQIHANFRIILQNNLPTIRKIRDNSKTFRVAIFDIGFFGTDFEISVRISTNVHPCIPILTLVILNLYAFANK